MLLMRVGVRDHKSSGRAWGFQQFAVRARGSLESVNRLHILSTGNYYTTYRRRYA